MPAQLEILALEPFYGGPRKAMLDCLIKHSRHHWTLLKLPPRRIERRLAAAAHWFAEQLTLHAVGRVDLLFTSEALNLSDFYRLAPGLVGKPSVVYFHSNQLPPPDVEEDFAAAAAAAPSILANLSTAVAAQELWFNTAYHQQQFIERAGVFIERHSQTFTRNPVAEFAQKSRLMPPPTDVYLPQEIIKRAPVARDKRTFFINLNGADCDLIDQALATLSQRGEEFKLMTLGPDHMLSPPWQRTRVSEISETTVVEAMLKCGLLISAQADPMWDHHLILSMAAGCWPLAPNCGIYPELIKKPLDERCLYDLTPEGLVALIQDYWELELPVGHVEAMRGMMRRIHPVTAAKAMDDRLSELAATTPVHAHTPPPGPVLGF